MADTPKVELQLGGVWTDVSSFVRYEDRIKITRGQKKEGRSNLDNATCDLTFSNDDGRFSPRHPTSPYYGLIGRNTQIRVSLPYGSSYLRIWPREDTSQATAPDSSSLDVTDLDIRADVDADHWGAGDLAGKYEITGNQRSWWFGVEDGRLGLFWSPDGTLASRIVQRSTVRLPARRGRLAVRAALDVDNGAGGYTLTFYTSDAIGGAWTQLGDAVTGTSTTSVFASTAPIEVGAVTDLGITAAGNAALPGRYLAFELRDGIGGTVVASPDFSAQAVGATVFADAQGNTWTLAVGAGIDDRRYRFHGEVAEWPPKRDISGTDATASIKAAGISRRYKQGEATLRSTMFRAHTNPALTSVKAYWPCEDGKESTVIASGRPNDPPMVVQGTPALADYDDWTASGPMPTMNTGRFSGPVAPYTPTGEVFVYMFVYIETPPAAETSLLKISATGTARTWEIRLLANGNLRTRAWAADGSELTDSSTHGLGDEVAFALNPRGFLMLKLQLVEVGLNLSWETSIIDFTNVDTVRTSPTTVGFADTTLSSIGVGRVSRVMVADDRTLGGTKISHVVVSDDVDRWLSGITDAIAAYNGEPPVDRLSRLCAEEDVTLTVAGITSSEFPEIAVTMGDQLDRSLLDLLQEAADTDGGLLHETCDRLGFGYRTRLSLYNQAPALTLSCAAHQLNEALTLTDDDQGTVNDVTVKREAGSSVRVEETSGPLSTLDPPNGVGRYDTSVTLSLERDDQLADQAGWRLHLGTTDEARYPKIQVHLAHPAFAGDAALKTAALSVDVGDRIVITDPSADLPPDDISQLVVGYSEVIDQFEHVITYVCQPETPWHVGEVGAAGYDRLDSAGSALAAAATSTATSLTVASSGALWTTAAADLPFDIFVAGERMTVTAISGTTSPQTFTVTRSVNGVAKAQASGAAVSIAEPVYVAL